MLGHQAIKLNMINKFRIFLYLIKYFLLRNFVRKYKISPIQNYGFVVNDYLVYENKLDLLFNYLKNMVLIRVEEQKAAI